MAGHDNLHIRLNSRLPCPPGDPNKDTSEDSTNTAAVNVTTRTEFSEILTNNDININSSASLSNISGLFESIAGATSTLSKHSNILPPPFLLSPLRSPSHA